MTPHSLADRMTKDRIARPVAASEAPHDPTGLGSWGLVIARALRARGSDPVALFARAGLDLAMLADPDVRIPVQATDRVLRLAVEETRDPCFGLEVAKHITATTFQALGFAMLSSGTLREAFERIVRYFRFVSEAATMSLEEGGGAYRFAVRITASLPPAEESIDAFFAVTVRLCRILTDPSFAPRGVELRRRRPPDPAPFARCFRAPVTFSAAEDAMTFDKRICDRRLAGAKPEVARVNDRVIGETLARLHQAQLTDKVRALLVDRFPSGEPSQAEIALAIGSSTRALQRRLSAEGMTYAQLVDETRRELALAYVRETRYSLTEVAYLLGFATPGAFTRAFRRWTGRPPSEHRRGASNSTTPDS